MLGYSAQEMVGVSTPLLIHDAQEVNAHAARLSAEQAARLAAMAPAPRLFERNPDSVYLAGRVATILARMPAAAVP